MQLRASYQKHRLKFKFEAGTSRGVLREHTAHYVRFWDKHNPQVIGIGECSPLKGLSIDDREDFEEALAGYCDFVNSNKIDSFEQVMDIVPSSFPSIRFAFETAWLDLINGGKRLIFANSFSNGEEGIPINGLVWMGKLPFMQEQVKQKIRQKYHCIKIKIGAIEWEKELKLLTGIRKHYDKSILEIRVDANGAFDATRAQEIMKALSKLDVHSIEQPVKVGAEGMRELCMRGAIPVALDEELIGAFSYAEKLEMIQRLSPKYIVLKPTLLGGIQATKEWIAIANDTGVGWWITSALESNIGLNAIAQFVANYHVSLPQGLGTGQLYTNNISSPLIINDGAIFYDKSLKWDDNFFKKNI